MRLLPPRGERALPLLAGVLLALAYPPAEILLPSFVGLAPLLVFIDERAPGSAGRWSATRAGLLTGGVYFGIQLYWMAVALIHYSALAIPAYALTVLVLAGLAGAFGWAVHFTRDRLRLPLPLAAAVFWTTLEWVQGHLGDLAFPWLGLGTSLASFPRVAGAADLVGARGLTFWLAAVNGMVAVLVLRSRDGRPVRALALATASLVLVPAAYGFARAATLELRPAARIAVVQPNIPEEVKLDRAIAVDSSLASLSTLMRSLADGRRGDGGDGGNAPDLVLWPEVALPADLAASRSLVDTVAALSRMAGAPILVGAYAVDDARGIPVAFNSAFTVDGTGIRSARYDKRVLVPFVERVPFLDPRLVERFTGDLRYFGALGRGAEAPVFSVGAATGPRFGVLICYESIFARLGRRYRAAGADFLVNITNDAWYGREPWYARTTALWQHPAHLALRAIETRMGIARAANTGISLFVDPIGRTYARTDLFEPDLRVGTVFTTDSTPLFVRWGDWLGSLSLFLAALLLALASRRPSHPPP